jgi:hypothetical protein
MDQRQNRALLRQPQRVQQHDFRRRRGAPGLPAPLPRLVHRGGVHFYRAPPLFSVTPKGGSRWRVRDLRCTTSGVAGNGLGATMKYLRHTTSTAANNGLSTTIIPPRSAAFFSVNSEPHTGARPSVRLCVGPELARCVHQLRIQLQNRTSNDKSKRRHLGWNPHAHLKPNPEPSQSFRRVI